MFDGRWGIISLWLRHGFGVTLVADDCLAQIRKEIGETQEFEMENFVIHQKLLSKSMDGS